MADERRVTIQEMAAAIRKKHNGAYADVDDVELVKAVVSKFPAYKSQISNWSDTLQTPMTRMQDATGEQNTFPVASEQQLASMPEQQPVDLSRQQPRMTTQGLYTPTAAGATPAAYVAEQFRQGNVEQREPRERRPFSDVVGDVFSGSQTAAIPAGSAARIVEMEQEDPFQAEGVGPALDALNYISEKFKISGNRFGQTLINTPNTVIRWSNVVPSMIYKQMGMPDELAEMFTNQPLNNERGMNYFEEIIKRHQKKALEYNPDAEVMAIDAAFDRNWPLFFKNAFGMVAESSVPSMAMMGMGAAGIGAGGMIGTSALMFGTMELNELDANNPDTPELTKLVVATAKGSIEGVFETFLGSGAMGAALKRMFATLPKDVAADQINKGFRTMLVDFITKNPYIAPLGEGVEEFFTEISQGLIDKYSGIDPDLTMGALIKRAGNAFIAGVFSGAAHSGGLYSAQAGIRTAESMRARSTERKLQGQIVSDFQSAQSNLDALIEQKPELIPLVNQIMEGEKGFAHRSQSLLESINGRGIDGAELSQQEVSTVMKYFLAHDQYSAMQNAKEFTKQRDLERFRAQQHQVAEEQLKAIRHEDGSIIKARVAIDGKSVDTYVLSGNPAVDGNSIVVIDPNTGENKMVSSNAVSKKSIQIMEQAQASEELHAHVDERVDQQAQELETSEEQAATTVEALIKGTVIYYDGYEGIVESQTLDGGILFIPAGMTIDDVEYIPKESIGLVEVISSPSTESMVAAGAEEVLIPRNEDGTVDYESEAMTPELLAQLYSEEFGVEDAITDLQELVAQNQEEAQNLRTSRPKGAASVSQKTENKRKAKALEEYNTKLQRAIEVLQGTQQEGAQEGQQRVVQQSRTEKIVDANNPESILRNENGDPIILTKATTSAITSQKAMDLWLYENAKNYLADTSDNARAAINAMNPKKLTSFEREFLTESFFGSKQINLGTKEDIARVKREETVALIEILETWDDNDFAEAYESLKDLYDLEPTREATIKKLRSQLAGTGNQVAEIERRRIEKLLGPAFASTREVVRKSGKTIIISIEAKVSSDGEIISVKPVSRIKGDGGIVAYRAYISIQEFRDQFYDNLSQFDKEMFDDIFGNDPTIRISLNEMRVGLVGSSKGQVNIDIVSDEGQEFGFELQNGKEINAEYDAELAALGNQTKEVTYDQERKDGLLPVGGRSEVESAPDVVDRGERGPKGGRLVELSEGSGQPGVNVSYNGDGYTVTSTSSAGEYFGVTNSEGETTVIHGSKLVAEAFSEEAALMDIAEALDLEANTTSPELIPDDQLQNEIFDMARLANLEVLPEEGVGLAMYAKKLMLTAEDGMTVRQVMAQAVAEYNQGKRQGLGRTPLKGIVNPSANGSSVTKPAGNYNDAVRMKAAGDTGSNLWIRQSPSAVNKNRTLLVQFSSRFLYGKQSLSRDTNSEYFDTLYRMVPGYDRTVDFWEIPLWMGRLSALDSNSDVYVIRNVEEAIEFFSQAGYGKISFSALDVNAKYIQQIAQALPKQALAVGGYTNFDSLEKLDNVRIYKSVEDYAKQYGLPIKHAYDYKHFGGTRVIPRLKMSDGCKYKCAFCSVPKQIINAPNETIWQQVEAIRDLDAKLVYLDDKTFGQASNYEMLPAIRAAILKYNPDFEGFVIQTTSLDFASDQKFSDEFIEAAGIKYVELGVESYNDETLTKLNKKHSHAKYTDAAMEKARRTGVKIIPNLIVGMSSGKKSEGTFWTEGRKEYENTLAWLEANSDIISHVNVYNLAIYDGTELADNVEVKLESDKNENIIEKSWQDNKEDHRWAMEKFSEFALNRVKSRASDIDVQPVTFSLKANEEQGAPMTKDQITEEVEKQLHSDEEGMVTLRHYTGVDGLRELLPAKFGTNASFTTQKRRAGGVTFYYPMGAGPTELGLGTKAYAAKVEASKLYPLHLDPLNIEAKARAKAQEYANENMGGRTIGWDAETFAEFAQPILKEMGYDGLFARYSFKTGVKIKKTPEVIDGFRVELWVNKPVAYPETTNLRRYGSTVPSPSMIIDNARMEVASGVSKNMVRAGVSQDGRSFYYANEKNPEALIGNPELSKVIPPEVKAEWGRVRRLAAFADNQNGELRTGQWAVFTAWNPGDKHLPLEENRARNEKLRQDLEDAGYEFELVPGKYTKREESFYIKGITAEEAIALGQKHNQESVLVPEGLLYQNGMVNPADINNIDYRATRSDMYTVFTVDGFKVRVHVPIDWNTEIPLEEAKRRTNEMRTQENPNDPLFSLEGKDYSGDPLYETLRESVAKDFDGYPKPLVVDQSGKIGPAQTEGDGALYVDIRKPVFILPDSDVVTFRILTEQLTPEQRLEIALLLEDEIVESGALEEYEGEYTSIQDVLEENPGIVNDAILSADIVMNNEDVVEILRQAGFDGAIFGTSMSDNLSVEYKPFSETQILDEDGNIATMLMIGKKGAQELDELENGFRRMINLDQARQMEAAKKDAKTIKLATGWERGADGLWRLEITDDGVVKLNADDIRAGRTTKNKLGEPFMRLHELWESRKLFDAWPEISDYIVVLSKDTDVDNASYTPKEATGTGVGYFTFSYDQLFAEEKNPGKMKKLILHEVQHAIQELEGFARGGSTATVFLKHRLLNKSGNIDTGKVQEFIKSEMSKIDERMKDIQEQATGDREAMGNKDVLEEKGLLTPYLRLLGLKGALYSWAQHPTSDAYSKYYYYNLSGETEARNAALRSDMDPDARRTTLLMDTEDVARADQIKIMRYYGIFYNHAMQNEDIEPQFMMMWHGSPHAFDKFSTENIGTGEGVQAFGWGLYFTDIQDIARFYAEKLSVLSVDGKSFYDILREEASSEMSGNLMNIVLKRVTMRAESDGVSIKDYDSLISYINSGKLEDWTGGALARVVLNKQIGSVDGFYNYLSDIVDIAKKYKNKLSLSRNLYSVKIHGDKDVNDLNWLEWDQRMTENIKAKIEQEIEKYGGGSVSVQGPLLRNETGQNMYEGLVDYFGGSKEASLFLLRAGIDGIRYPAESVVRGATRDNARGFNYVVFDENAIEIEERAQFSLTASEQINEKSSLIDSALQLTEGREKASADLLDKLQLPLKKKPRVSEVVRAASDYEKALSPKFKILDRKSKGKMIASTRNIARMAHIIKEVALHRITMPHTEEAPNPIGWYDVMMDVCEAIILEAYPEAKTDPNLVNMWKALLAITSNGMEVSKNAELSIEALEYYIRNGRLDQSNGYTRRPTTTKKHLALINRLVNEWGIDEFIKYLGEKRLVRQIREETGASLSTRKAKDLALGASMFGPKLGEEFYGSLIGKGEKGTIDVWMIRFAKMFLGDDIGVNPKTVEKNVEELRKAISKMDNPFIIKANNGEVAAIRMKGVTKKALMDNDDTLIEYAEEVDKVFKKNREYDGLKKAYHPVWETALTQAAKKVNTNFRADDSISDNHRDAYQRAIQMAASQLQEDGFGVDATDVQAAVWYFIKDYMKLANTRGVDTRTFLDGLKKSADIKSRGVTNKKIDEIINQKTKEKLPELEKKVPGKDSSFWGIGDLFRIAQGANKVNQAEKNAITDEVVTLSMMLDNSGPVKPVDGQMSLLNAMIANNENEGAIAKLRGYLQQGNVIVNGFYSPWTGITYYDVDAVARTGKTPIQMVLHEQGYHHGIRLLVPDSRALAQFHQRVADFIGEEELRNVIGDSVTFEQYSKNKAALGEEYMARMAEKIAADQVLSQKEKTIWQRFIAEIRALIKKIIYGKGEITQDGLAEIRMAALESVKGYQKAQAAEQTETPITSISELFSGTTSTYNISTSLIPKDGPRAVVGDQEGLFSISSADNTESASEGETKDYMGMLKELKDKLSEHKAQGKQMLRREIVEQFIRENRPYLKMLNPGRIAPALNRVNKAARSNIALDAAIANLERVISEGMNSAARKKADAFVKRISKIKTEKRSNGIITASLLLQEDVDYKNKVAMIAVMDRDAADTARKSLEADIETYEDALENDPDNQQLKDQIADVEATLNILDMYSNLRDRPLAWVEHAIATWNADFKEMKVKFREKRNADREARMERTRRVAEDLSGSEEVLEKIKLEDVIPAAKRAQSSIALEYQAMHGSISSLIHAVWRGFKSGQRSSDFYQSELYRLYMAVDRGASRKIEMHEAMMERVNNHITNTYKSVNEFKKDMDSEIEITLERQKGKGETLEYVPRTVKVKVDAALHLWASYKSEGNNRYMDNIDFMSDRHRFSQEAWEALDAALSERQKDFANLMATDFFGAEEYYDAVNAVYSRRTGRQMPRVQDYIPVAANSWKNQVPYDVNNLGIYKSVAKERRGGAYDLDRNGLYRAATKYADDVSSFAHLAEPVSDLAYTLNSRLIRSASKAMGTYDKVQRIIDLLNKGYNRDHFDGQRIINWMMSRFTATKILMNYNLLPKQLTSTIAMFDPDFGNPAETLAAFVQYITPGAASEVKATIKKLVKNHPDLKFRNITNIESLTDQRRFKINLKMYGDSPSQIARATLMTALYNPTSVGDRIAIQWGAVPVAMANYKRALKDAKKMGMDDTKAESYASLAATDAMAEFINQTQQSSKLTHRSAFQYGGYRIAAAFMNSIMGYARKVTRHARGINRDYQAGFVRAMKEGDNTSVAAMKALAAIEPSKVAALFMYTTVMPVLFTTVATLGGNFARMWDDDDEERRAARLNMAFDAMLGWTKGLYGLGFFLQYAFKQATGQFYGSKDDNITPIVDDSTELIMQITRAAKLLSKYNDEDIKNRPEYEQKLRDALIKTGITGMGLWKGTPVTFMSRIMDVTTKEEYDEVIKVVARLYGLPVKEIERMFSEDPTTMIDPDVAPYLDASVTEFLMEMKDRDESIGKTFQPTKYARKWMAYQLFDVEQDIQARMDINMLLSSTSNQKKAELIVKRYEGYNDVMSFYEGFVHPYTQPLGEFSYFDDSGKQRSGKLRDGLMTVGMQKTMWKEIAKNIERSGMTRDEKIENFSTVMAILSNISKPEEMTDYYSRLEQLQKSIE